MAIITSFQYGSGFSTSVGGSELLAFSSAVGAIQSIPVGEYQDATIITNAAFDAWIADTQNTKYVSSTEVDLGAGTVTLDAGNVATADVPIRIDWQDDGADTALSNAKFFVFDGTTPATAPSGALFMAFERRAAAISTNQIGGDVAGQAWDGTNGIGGSAAALDIEDKASAASHQFFLGLSVTPTTYGRQTAIRFRLEFDAA